MNSYPPELLMQLAPVMFAAGLDPPQPGPLQSPPRQPDRDPFANLIHRLRDSLLAQRKLALWHPPSPDPRNNYLFHVVIVDRNVRFPPRKFVNPDDPHATAHSLLSPLTPSSPLYPDGLIAPIWIRKHTTLVPSVFVLFTRLYEYISNTPRSPLDGPDQEREHEERKRDEELASEIALRKKSTTERGMKLTVVLLASRKLLDDPALDNRLTFIRRNSGLDSRAALFVLSPVSQAELGEFVKSLQQALYEPALEYYTNHSKRVRRKRNRHATQTTSYTNPITPVTRPLRPEGWTVRYEYKMACFAEFRGEGEVALKHYQDSYSTLVLMFGSTAILPPRTKRWAEAKVLVDCINIKICKLYLYNNEHALALSQHTGHIRKFGDFSRGWGIGEETFEYWSWLARQHRVLSELLEYGLRSETLILPVHIPLPPPPPSASINPGLRLEPYALRGLNPTQALQHPGFYYYAAAKCTEMRRKRFLEAVDSESRGLVNASFPGYTNEKKVDHLAIILELYTKAYEHFKQSNPEGPGRLTLWIAGRIGETYYESGKFDMAIKFFERIAKSYRTEKWGATLRPLLSTWYECARRLGDVELSIKLLIEMLGHGAFQEEDPSSLQEDLVAILKSTVPSSPEQSLVVDLAESHPIFDCRLVFWEPKVRVGEPAAFQFWFTAPTQVDISELPITEIMVYSGERLVISLVHDPKVQPSNLVNIGEVSVDPKTDLNMANACLRWEMGKSLVVAGTVTSEEPATFSLSNVVVKLKEGDWNIEVPIQFSSSPEDLGTWLVSMNSMHTISKKKGHTGSLNFVQRPHQMNVSSSHSSPAYLDEEYPITISVTNADDRPLELTLDALLQPCEIDNAVNSIRLDEERSSGLIKGVRIGTLQPGSTTFMTLYLLSSSGAGDRTLDISVQSRTIPTDSAQPIEHLRTIVIPTVAPFLTETTVEYRRDSRPTPALGDLATFESQLWKNGDSGIALLRTSFECSGPWAIEVQSVKLVKKKSKRAKIIHSSTDNEESDFPSEFYPGDQFCCQCTLVLDPVFEGSTAQPISTPAEYLVSWKRTSSTEASSATTSKVTLPALEPPIDGLIALLDVPTTAKLHTPTLIRLTIRNRHPTRSAIISVHLEPPPPNAEDPFIVAGLRSGRLPLLLAGSEQQVTWRIVPVECGDQPAPKIRVIDRRDASMEGEGVESEGNDVQIIDTRYDGVGAQISTILVLP